MLHPTVDAIEVLVLADVADVDPSDFLDPIDPEGRVGAKAVRASVFVTSSTGGSR